MQKVSYRRPRFPAAIIQHAVWLYFPFALGYRDLENLLAKRGIEVSYETVRRWALKFGQAYARELMRSSLADANAKRPHEVFTELFAEITRRAHRGLRRNIGGSLYLIDSTGLRLSALSADWARFSAGVCGAKAHVIYDPDTERPIYAAIRRCLRS